MDTLNAIWAVVAALWNTGNRLARWAIGMILLWPLLLVIVALSGNQLLVSIVALLPVLSVLFLFLIFLDPLVLAVAATFQRGQSALRWIATIIGVELVIGIYFSAVPVANDRGLVPLLILIPFAILFLAIGKKNKLTGTIIAILTVMIAVLTLVIGAGGREKADRIFKRTVAFTGAHEADVQNIWPKIGETVKIEIYPDRWSGWINLPPNAKAVVDAPGDIEYLFLDGERFFFKDESVKPFNAPSCSFRIRGTAGEVALTIEPFAVIQ